MCVREHIALCESRVGQMLLFCVPGASRPCGIVMVRPVVSICGQFICVGDGFVCNL